MDATTTISNEELTSLRNRLAEAEDMLRAIRAGEVDAIVVNGPSQPAVYTLKGAADPYRLLIEQMSEGALTVSASGVILYCNAAFAQMMRRPRERVIGGAFGELFVQRPNQIGPFLARTERGGEEIEIRIDSGEIIHAYVSSTALVVDDEPVHCLVVTNLSRQELRLRYEAIVKSSPDAIYTLQPDGTIENWNAAAEHLHGFTAQDAVGANMRILFSPQDHAEISRRLRSVLNGQTAIFDALCSTKDGERREFSIGMSPIAIFGEGVKAIAVIARDITERKQAEDRIRFLMHEVDHRAKNMLAVVQAIASLNAFHGDPKTFVNGFSERLAALAQCYNLLVQSKWTGVDLHALIDAYVSSYTPNSTNRIKVQGPPLFLSPGAAQTIGMALHELATNATKYGALSVETGHISIDWAIKDQNIELRWAEHGAPCPEPPTRRGFGYTVTVTMVTRSLHGDVKLEFPRSGCVWEVTAPLDRLLPRAIAPAFEALR